MMSGLAERLKKLREERHLSQYQVARDLGVPRTTYANWEQGKAEPDSDTLKKIADYFDVSVDYLLGLTEDPTPPKSHFPSRVKLRPIPVYNGACAGLKGSFPDGTQPVEWIMIPDNKPGKFGVIVYGDSMEPEIKNGDIVVVDPDIVIDNGNLVLVILEDEAFVKKIFFQDGTVVLQSLNPKYPPITIPARKIKMYIVGKVVGLHRQY